MATELRLRRGTTDEHGNFIGAEAEATVDTDKNTIVVHDGQTQGGFPMSREDSTDVAVDSVADLRASSFPSNLERLWLSGYYGVGTAGGGPFHRVGSGFTSSDDNGGTELVDADGVKWKRDQDAANLFYVTWFGAKGDDSADDLPAFEAAREAANDLGGGTVIIPKPSVAYRISDTFENGYDRVSFVGYDAQRAENTVIKPASGVSCAWRSNGQNHYKFGGLTIDMSDMEAAASITASTISFDANNLKIFDSGNGLGVFSENEFITVEGASNDGNNDTYYIDQVISSGEILVSGPIFDESEGSSVTISRGPFGWLQLGGYMWQSENVNVTNIPDTGIGIAFTTNTPTSYGVYWSTHKNWNLDGTGTGVFLSGGGRRQTSIILENLRAFSELNGIKIHKGGSGLLLINPYPEGNFSRSKHGIYVTNQTSTRGARQVQVWGGEGRKADCLSPNDLFLSGYADVESGSGGLPDNPIYQNGHDFGAGVLGIDGIQSRSSNSSQSIDWSIDFSGNDDAQEISHDGFSSRNIVYKEGEQGKTGEILFENGWRSAVNLTYEPISLTNGQTETINGKTRFVGLSVAGLASGESATLLLPDSSSKYITSGTRIEFFIYSGNNGSYDIDGNGTDIVLNGGGSATSVNVGGVGSTTALVFGSGVWMQVN